MARYRFHCTKGHECVADCEGEDIPFPTRLDVRARQVAQSLMRSFHDQRDWLKWHVTVHDLNGRQVLLQRFVSRAEEPQPSRPERPSFILQQCQLLSFFLA